MSDILAAVGNLVAYMVGGTVGSGSDAVTITAANSWLGQFATAITSNPIIEVFCIASLAFLGLNALRKLMRV